MCSWTRIGFILLIWTINKTITKTVHKRIVAGDPTHVHDHPSNDPNLRGFKPIKPPPHSGEYVNSHTRGYSASDDSISYGSTEIEKIKLAELKYPSSAEIYRDYPPGYHSTEFTLPANPKPPSAFKHPSEDFFRSTRFYPKRFSSIENRMRSPKTATLSPKKPATQKFNHSAETTRRKPHSKRYTKPGLVPLRHSGEKPFNNVQISGGFKPIKSPSFTPVSSTSFQVTKWNDHPLSNDEHKEFVQHDHEFKYNFADPGFDSAKTVNYTTIHRKEKPPPPPTLSTASFSLPSYDVEDHAYTKFNSYDTYGGDTVLDLPPYVPPLKNWHKDVPIEIDDDDESSEVRYSEPKYGGSGSSKHKTSKPKINKHKGDYSHDHYSHDDYKPSHKHSHGKYHHSDHSDEHHDSSHESYHDDHRDHSDHKGHRDHQGHHDHDHRSNKHNHHDEHRHNHSRKHKHKRNHRHNVIKIMHHG